MAIEGNYESITLTAAADLSGLQYFPVTAAGAQATGATAYATAIGLNQEKPLSGEHFRCAWKGELKFRAGGAVAAGGWMTINASGYSVAATSGDITIGRAYLAVTSGSIGTGLFDFSNYPGTSVVSHA